MMIMNETATWRGTGKGEHTVVERNRERHGEREENDMDRDTDSVRQERKKVFFFSAAVRKVGARRENDVERERRRKFSSDFGQDVGAHLRGEITNEGSVLVHSGQEHKGTLFSTGQAWVPSREEHNSAGRVRAGPRESRPGGRRRGN
ncbi:unnamed protein product [Calypogeia fissa]